MPEQAFSEIRAYWVLAASISESTTDNKEVCGGTEQTGLRFYSPNGAQKRRASRRVFEPRVEVGQDPGRALDPHERFDREARLGRFVAQLLGEVEVGGREPLGSSAWVRCCPSRTSRSTISSNLGSSRKPRSRPS